MLATHFFTFLPVFNAFRLVVLKSVLLMAALILSACNTHPPRDPNTLVPSLTPNKQHIYDDIKQNLIDREPDIDFDQFRLAYTQTPLYTPWDTNSHEASLAMFNAQEDGNFELCLAFSEAILAQNYTSLSGHFGALACHLGLEQHTNVSYHRYVISGLMQSIESSGDGLSPETAYVTISPAEMRSFLQIKGFLSYRQEYQPLGAKHIEKMYVIDSKTEKHHEFYFDNSLSLLPGLSIHPPQR